MGGVAASLGSFVVPPLLRNGNVVRAAAAATAAADPGRWRFSGAHWGAFRARVVAGHVVEIKPFEFDKHPTPILDGTLDVLYSPSRVRYPMVRLDWYRNRRAGAAPSQAGQASRGDNRFIRVGWDEALDLVYDELERIQKDYGPWGAARGQRRLALGGTDA